MVEFDTIDNRLNDIKIEKESGSVLKDGTSSSRLKGI